MTADALVTAALANGCTLAEYAEGYRIHAAMERANAHLRRREGSLSDARVCARLSGSYLARAAILAEVADDYTDCYGPDLEAEAEDRALGWDHWEER